ncbi:hypothetical protein [Streptomyces sp. NPDC020917]|uniref:hypothetical protein n=1 Tax=Streptomyces sp. NPDC020917 TaxID=3365102 RepID=UPI00379D0F46
MATEAEPQAVGRDGDRLLLALLARLATTGGRDFLPDVPSSMLVTVVSCYHRRQTRVGFPETAAERA